MLEQKSLIVTTIAPVVGQVTVGTTATQLTNQANLVGSIVAHPGNTGVIYVGFSSGVTSANGFPLTTRYDVIQTNMNLLWAIGTAVGDKVCFIANN